MPAAHLYAIHTKLQVKPIDTLSTPHLSLPNQLPLVDRVISSGLDVCPFPPTPLPSFSSLKTLQLPSSSLFTSKRRRLPLRGDRFRGEDPDRDPLRDRVMTIPNSDARGRSSNDVGFSSDLSSGGGLINDFAYS